MNYLHQLSSSTYERIQGGLVKKPAPMLDSAESDSEKIRGVKEKGRKRGKGKEYPHHEVE